LHAEGDRLGLALDKRWLDARPLLRTDLASEPEQLADLNITMAFDTV
jgi:exopolyphosphatase/guanosine-5'-triphosphate,3'-diphosphate pyrophosphatase